MTEPAKTHTNTKVVRDSITRMPRSPMDRFWTLVDIRSDGECWLWTGVRNKQGYGRVSKRTGRTLMAHRVALADRLGRPIAEGMLAVHSCDNPPCVNPAHLSESTQSENIKQAFDRGRALPAQENLRRAFARVRAL